MSNAFKQFTTILQQGMQLMILALAIAIIVALYKTKPNKIGKIATLKPKSAQEALEKIMSHEGWILVTVDQDRCGYCKAAKIMLDVKGVPYIEVNISELPEDELEKFVSVTGVEWVPTLLYVRNGRIVFRKMFSGNHEEDVEWVRKLEVEA